MVRVVLALLFWSYIFALENPSNLKLVPTSHSVTLSWQDNADDETGYRIFRNEKFIAFLPADTISYTDNNLLPNTRYRYTVKATDAIINMGNWIRTNPGAGGTINMIGATADGTLVLASDLSGVYMRYKGSNQWSVKGEINGLHNTHISALGFHPNDGKIFYVGTGGGLYKTHDGGEHFDFINNLKHNDYNDTYVESVVVSKNNPDILYVTYHSWDNNLSSYIDKSIDGGESWSDVSLHDTSRLRIVKLIVHPKNPNILYAIAGKPRWGCSKAKAYGSKDGGLHWSVLDDKGDVVDIDVDPLDERIVYMSTFSAQPCPQNVYENLSMDEYVLNEGAGSLYKSKDYGDSFGNAILKKSGIISVDTQNGQKIKLIDILTMASAHWMENDYGANYTGSWKSEDGGKTWVHYGDVANWNVGYVENPYMKFQFAFNGLNKTLTKDLFDADKLYGANSWTMISSDGGKTFQSLSTKKVSTDKWRSTGIDNINGFALDVNDHNPNVVYMGGYDIGLWVSRDRGVSWEWKYPYKWHSVADDSFLYNLNRYTWGATTDPNEPSTLKQIGGSNVMTVLSDPNGAGMVWSSFARSQSFIEAEVNHTHPEKSDRSGLFYSHNYGDTWKLSRIYNKDGSLLSPYSHIIFYGLSIDKNSNVGSRTLYVTVNGDLAKSTDNGVSWHIIQKNGGLKFTAVGEGVVYAGGESGLWRLKTNGVWEQIGGAYLHEMEGVGSPMYRDVTPQENDAHYENYNKIIDKYAWNGVSSIAVDPNNPKTIYVTVFSQKHDNEVDMPNYIVKGLYRSTTGGDSWNRVPLGEFENNYLRSVQVHPDDSNIIFVCSSESINSGGEAGSSVGIIYSTDAGLSWQEANNAMAWKFATTLKIDSTGNRIWSWGAGTGVQYVDILP